VLENHGKGEAGDLVIARVRWKASSLLKQPALFLRAAMSTTLEKPEVLKANDCKYRPIMLVWIYRYAKGGMAEHAIAEALYVSTSGWKKWKKRYPEIEEALKLGRTETKDGGDWHTFIYERLPGDLKVLWDQINEWDAMPNGMVKIETLLTSHGKLVRQQLFLFALVCFNFSKSKAMSKVCIDKDTLDYWIKHDERFARLVEEIEWHKDNFFEESLVNLIKGGDTAATIFANKNRNGPRGYNSVQNINVNHTGHIDHHALDLDDLELSQSCKIEILEAMRKRDERLHREKMRPTLAVEYRVLEDIDAEIGREAVEVLNQE
jgi:hypothetical protein